jgi:transposase InsO family protein
MKENNIRACGKRKFKHTTDSNHTKPIAPNLLNRNFDVSEPNTAWAGDITYIDTDEGWLYSAVVIDLFNREVVGWAFSHRINEELVIQALKNALVKRSPEHGCIFHSDRGSQYCGNEFRKMVRNNGLIQSMSRKGNCWDNACVESFFHTMKIEEVYQYRYPTRLKAKTSLIEYIEVFYNRLRKHSTLGYKSPVEYLTEFYKNLA